MNRGSYWNCVFLAVINGELDTARRELDAGADVNKRSNDNKCSPLHYAVLMDNLPMVQLLLEYKADVNITDSGNQTPLHYVSLHSRKKHEICMLLLENGADCNAADIHGHTPLHLALKKRSLYTVKMLLDYGADITDINRLGMTSLHFAAQNHLHIDVLEFMLDRGFDIERGCNQDFSALFYAAFSGGPKACELLLKRGAMVNRRSDMSGDIPLTVAIKSWNERPQCEKERVLEVLLEYGAYAAEGKKISGEGTKQGKCRSIRRILARYLVNEDSDRFKERY